MNIIQTLRYYWFFTIPGIIAIFYIISTFPEGAYYDRLKARGVKPPKSSEYPSGVWWAAALFIFLFYLWFNCGMMFWEMGLRPALLIASVLAGALFLFTLVRSRRIIRRTGQPFWVRRTLGSLFKAWFPGCFGAAFFHDAAYNGFENTAVNFVIQLFVIALPILFFGALVFFGGLRLGPDTEEDKERDLAYEAKMLELIERGRRKEEIENERRYREYWGEDTSDLDYYDDD